MELCIIIAVIFVFVFLNSLPSIAGSLATPPGMVFLGTVHWPGDYFYYLSQFAQGKTNWFTSFDLYSNDFLHKTWVGWVNVFIGRLFSLVGIHHLLAYQLSLILFAITFLTLSYLLIREIFPDRKRERIITFLLFASSNAFPKLVVEGGRWSLSYYDFWFNIGIPFNRLGGVPHHLIARSVMVLTFWLFIRYSQKQRTIYQCINLSIVSLLGFILGSIDPVQWGIVIVVLVLTFFLNKVTTHLQLTTHNLPLFPSLFFFLGGLPIVLYLKNLFTMPPYVQLALWERTQQMHPGIITFILGNGPVMVLAILSIFFFARKVTPVRILTIVFTSLTIFLYFSPIPEILGIVNVRFLPGVTTLFLACMAAEAVVFFLSHLSRLGSFSYLLIILIIFLLFLPAYRMQIQIRTTPDTKNGFFYITKDAYEIYTYAAQISTVDDTFLVMWPFNWSFPGITGRRVFVGHSLLTTDFAKKDTESFLFFDGKMSQKEAEAYLRRNKITFVVTYPWTPKIGTYPFLKLVSSPHTLGIYKIIL